MTLHARSSFERLQWTFPLAVTLHNLEEAIWLPSWAARHSADLPWQVSPVEFRIAATILTAATYAVTWLSIRKGRQSVWTYLFVAYTVVMFLNVFVPHVPATIIFRSYTPGVATAVTVILPVTALLLIRALQERLIQGFAACILVFGAPLAIMTLVAVLFAVHLRR